MLRAAPCTHIRGPLLLSPASCTLFPLYPAAFPPLDCRQQRAGGLYGRLDLSTLCSAALVYCCAVPLPAPTGHFPPVNLPLLPLGSEGLYTPMNNKQQERVARKNGRAGRSSQPGSAGGSGGAASAAPVPHPAAVAVSMSKHSSIGGIQNATAGRQAAGGRTSGRRMCRLVPVRAGEESGQVAGCVGVHAAGMAACLCGAVTAGADPACLPTCQHRPAHAKRLATWS